MALDEKVSTYTIFPNFIDLSAETVLSPRFGGHKGGVAKGEKGRRGSVLNQGKSLGQPKRSLRVAITVCFNYKRDWIRVPNLKSRSAR